MRFLSHFTCDDVQKGRVVGPVVAAARTAGHLSPAPRTAVRGPGDLAPACGAFIIVLLKQVGVFNPLHVYQLTCLTESDTEKKNI